MIDLIDNYYVNQNVFDYSDIDTQKVSKNAVESVLPLILKNELTERQRICLKMKYVQNLSQMEISEKLHFSQPTVSRHIASAKDVVNNRLSYCLIVLNRANSIWLKSNNNI